MEPDLWQPPPALASRHNRWNDDADAALYRRLSHQISKSWNTDVLQSLPPELHKKTPFSLDMLRLLAQLASLTKSNMAQAHDLLMLQYKHRQEYSDYVAGDDEWVTTIREGRRHKKPYLHRSRENRLGLMLEDAKGVTTEVQREANNLARSGNTKSAKNAKDTTNASQHISKNERRRQALAGVLREARNKGVGEVDRALDGFDLDKEREQVVKTRRQHKLAKRREIATRKREEDSSLPLDRLQLGTLPVRSTAEVDTERMMARMGSLSHTERDPRAFEFRMKDVEDMDQDDNDDDESESEKDDD